MVGDSVLDSDTAELDASGSVSGSDSGTTGVGTIVGGGRVRIFLQQDLKQLLTLLFLFLWHFNILAMGSFGGVFLPSFRLMHRFTPAMHFFWQLVGPFLVQ